MVAFILASNTPAAVSDATVLVWRYPRYIATRAGDYLMERPVVMGVFYVVRDQQDCVICCDCLNSIHGTVLYSSHVDD